MTGARARSESLATLEAGLVEHEQVAALNETTVDR
jgi:hypothetical protein